MYHNKCICICTCTSTTCFVQCTKECCKIQVNVDEVCTDRKYARTSTSSCMYSIIYTHCVVMWTVHVCHNASAESKLVICMYMYVHVGKVSIKYYAVTIAFYDSRIIHVNVNPVSV